MPLRFRSVVPYTLPGILALIGWWWYISRKKERITSPESTERFPVTESSLTSPTEGSNGLDERGTVSPQNDTTASGHQKGRKGGPQKVKNQQLAKQEVIALVHIPGLDSSPTHKETSVVAALYSGTVRADCEKINTPPTLAVLSSNDSVTPDSQATECGRMAQERRLVPVFSSVIKHEEEVKVSPQESYLKASVSSCQSAQVNHAYTTEADHAKVERPEPEGEVASVAAPCVGQPVPDHHTMVINKDEMVSKGPTATNKSSATPNKDSVEINTSLQGFYQHVRTSTPISAALAQGTASTPTNSSEGSIVYLRQQVSNTDDKEQELEILAAGLITEVISAATQEVLGVTSCQDTDNRQPGGSSTTNTPLTNGRLFSQQEPLVVVNRHLLIEEPSPIDCDFRAANLSEGDKQGVLNGFSSTVIWEPSEVSHREKATENTLRGHRPVGSHPTAQVAQLPNLATLKTAERVTLAEDCNSCHLEGAINKDGLHNSRPDHQVDLFRVLDMSRGEPTLPQQSDQTVTEAAVLAFAGGNTLDAVCAMKRLNGIGLKNDSHGMGEVDTDQSGGEAQSGSDVNSMDSVDSGCTMGALDNQSPHAAGSSSELIIWEIEVPKHLVGRLIGKQGRYVSFLKQNSAAKIYISTLPYTQEFQICHIEGAQQQVDKALSLIGKKFKDLDLTNLYASPPPPLTLPSLPMTSWLLLPSGVTVEVIVVNIVSAGHVFVQQHTHPTYHALRSLDQQMFLCYSQPGTPALPSPAEVGVICAAPAVEGAWWRAQVITFYKENNEVEIRYVDYGGYDRVKIDSLRQIRSDFVTLPFQGAEVLLDSIAPLPGEERFSSDANMALEDVTRGVALLAQVSNYDNNTGLPLVQLWNMVGDELVSVNRTLAERGFGAWVDSF